MTPLDEAVRAHDEALRARGLAVTLGAEPTFTVRGSDLPCWQGDAEGGDKEERARALLAALARRLSPAARTWRAEGRQYPGEAAPRFCHACAFPRDGAGAPVRASTGSARTGEAVLTVTPDPGVVEVNLAPAADLATFLADLRATYEAAAEVGLSPLRHRYNGDETDSGGGGQVTLGGPTPEQSPFFLHPQLLPRLVRLVQRHPSLSYAFSPDCAGSAGQGPRPDEGPRERFDELAVALDRLALRGARLSPEELAQELGPLLVDGAGNSHRAELNVEKLWNPGFGPRGTLGLVELRALRMPPTPERLAAVAALFRALCARCVAAPYEPPLADWGASLHDRCALPHFLEADLAAVLAELDAHGLGLAPPLASLLLAPREPLAEAALGGARLRVLPALEFWPLVGDVASQERQGARVVDSSSSRVELRVEEAGRDPGRLAAQGWAVPLEELGGGRHAGAVRFRAFVPRPGLHPGLAPHDPLVLHWSRGGAALTVTLHQWIPGGGAYAGLPADGEEARRRRRERAVVAPARPLEPAAVAVSGATLDLRRLPPLAAFQPTTAARGASQGST